MQHVHHGCNKFIGLALLFVFSACAMEQEVQNVVEEDCCPLNIQYFDFVHEPIIMHEEYLGLDEGDNEKKEHNDEDDYVIVEKQPFPQIDLSVFNKKQNEQKHILLSKGKLFFYEESIIKEGFKKFTNVKDHGFRALFRYVPQKIDTSKKPLMYVIIHGTWGRATEGYFKPNTPLLRNFLYYVAECANAQHTYVDLYSYEWAATNDDEARIYAGMLLGYMMNSIKEYYAMNIFAFSHGVNVGLVACNQLEECTVNEFVAVAPPVLENSAWFYAPHHIDDFYVFFSIHDLIRWVGHKWANFYDNTCIRYKGFCEKGLKDPFFDEYGITYKNSCKGRVINIWFTEDNYAPGHSETPDILSKYLIHVMNSIRTFLFKNVVRHISLNIVPQKEEYSYQLCNISLYPQSKEEEDVYQKELPETILKLSKKNEDDHFKLYGYKKNEESSIYTWYSLAKKAFN